MWRRSVTLGLVFALSMGGAVWAQLSLLGVSGFTLIGAVIFFRLRRPLTI